MIGDICPICRSGVSLVLDERPAVPIAQNIMFDTQTEAKACATGQLQMRLCKTCSFVWNARFDATLLIYDNGYENDQTFSPAFESHLNQVLACVENLLPDENIEIAEIGCGQGYFIERLRNRLGDRISRIFGFDPAYRTASDLPADVTVFSEYFDQHSMAKTACRPALVVSRHTIEHVDHPMNFLRNIRAAVDVGTIIALETPDVRWILENGVAQDFFYEHCSLFSPESISIALELSGFDPIETNILFDGQYMVAVARAVADKVEPRSIEGVTDLGYRSRRGQLLTRIESQLKLDVRDGKKIAFWGGASKGVTLALLIDRMETPIECAIDVNPRRQGKFMPISGIEIKSPDDAQRLSMSSIYVMNPVYTSEIKAQCRKMDWAVDIHIA